MIVNNTFYTDVSNTLERQCNDKNHKYMYGQKMNGSSPLDGVVPLYTNFWGPHVLSIVIISKNYGYESGNFNWPTAQVNSQKDIIRQAFSNWYTYKVYFYVDMVLANRVQAGTPSSQYRTQMENVAAKINEICAEMGDFGFTYKGTLEEGKDESFFKPLIEDFWKG